MTKKAAIYLRISKDDEATGLAVDRQREDCLEIIAARGWELVGEPYVDNAISASKRNVRRPAYDAMVAAYREGRFSALVCYDLDRLTRQPRQLEDWIDAAEESGLVLVTANGEADLATDNGRLFARIKASVARAEIERKGARQKRANIQRVQQGLPVPGRRRYGYESDGVTPREVEAAVVRRMFEAVASGASIRAVTRSLIADHVEPGTGKGWSTPRVRKMLLNPSYGGFVSSQGAAVSSEHVTPIVPAALAEEVRAIITDEARRTTTGPGRRYLSSGVAACGIDGCDRELVSHSGYYVCKIATNARTSEVYDDKRKHVGIKIELLDGLVRDAVALALLTTPREALAGSDDAAVAPLVVKLGKIEAATKAVLRDRDEELVSPTLARERLVELRDSRRAVEAQLDEARASRTSAASLSDLARELLPDGAEMSTADFFAIRRQVADHFGTLDIDRQRDAVRALVDVVVAPGRGAGRVHVWHKVAEHLNPEIGEARVPAAERRAPRVVPGAPAKSPR